jgi:hypothetical protein
MDSVRIEPVRTNGTDAPLSAALRFTVSLRQRLTLFFPAKKYYRDPGKGANRKSAPIVARCRVKFRAVA